MYNKITVISGSPVSFFIIKALFDSEKLLEVIIPTGAASYEAVLTKSIPDSTIRITEETERPHLASGCDLVILMGYPYKLAVDNEIPTINVHFGPLPENRGPDPVFWTLKEGKQLAYVAIHRVDESLDTGAILVEKGFDIMPGENYGMLTARLALQSVALIQDFLANNPGGTNQSETGVIYNSRPTEKDLVIDWESMTAFQIECLVNASNPKYGGALTYIQGNQVSLLEVTSANVNMPEDKPLPAPGTVVHSSAEHGLFVICSDQQYLRLDILSMVEGVFTGRKLATIGAPVGTVFSS